MLSRSDPLDPQVGPTLVGPSNNSMIHAHVTREAWHQLEEKTSFPNNKKKSDNFD